MIRLNPFKTPREWISALSAIAAGTVIWFSMRILTGADDPQSHLDYWRIGYPLALVASIILGYLFNVRPWRWGIYIIAIQLILGLTTLKGEPNLLPLGVIFHLVIAVPCIAMGYFGSWLSRKITAK